MTRALLCLFANVDAVAVVEHSAGFVTVEVALSTSVSVYIGDEKSESVC